MRAEDMRAEDMRTEDMRKDDIRTEDITAASTCLLRLQDVIKKRNGWRVLDHASVKTGLSESWVTTESESPRF